MKGQQLTKQAFEDRWWQMVRSGLPYVRAYHDLEAWHLNEFGSNRYSSYSSFANVRDKQK